MAGLRLHRSHAQCVDVWFLGALLARLHCTTSGGCFDPLLSFFDSFRYGNRGRDKNLGRDGR
jgi:hypothetical protein